MQKPIGHKMYGTRKQLKKAHDRLLILDFLGNFCVGELEQSRSCTKKNENIQNTYTKHYRYTTWSLWSTCSELCGEGNRGYKYFRKYCLRIAFFTNFLTAKRDAKKK